MLHVHVFEIFRISKSKKTERSLVEIGASLGILGQTEFVFNEEHHSKEKDLLTRISLSEGVLFRRKAKDGSPPGQMGI